MLKKDKVTNKQIVKSDTKSKKKKKSSKKILKNVYYPRDNKVVQE